MAGLGGYTREENCPGHLLGRWLVSALQVIWHKHSINRDKTGNEVGHIGRARLGSIVAYSEIFIP